MMKCLFLGEHSSYASTVAIESLATYICKPKTTSSRHQQSAQSCLLMNQCSRQRPRFKLHNLLVQNVFANQGSRQRPRFWRQEETFQQEVLSHPKKSFHQKALRQRGADARLSLHPALTHQRLEVFANGRTRLALTHCHYYHHQRNLVGSSHWLDFQH